MPKPGSAWTFRDKLIKVLLEFLVLVLEVLGRWGPNEALLVLFFLNAPALFFLRACSCSACWRSCWIRPSIDLFRWYRGTAKQPTAAVELRDDRPVQALIPTDGSM